MIEYIVFYSCGGLGNLLFQYNYAYSLAKRFNAKLYASESAFHCTRPRISTYNKFFSDLEFITKSELYSDEKFKPIQEFSEKFFFYEDFDFDQTKKTLIISGYFQSYKYTLSHHIELMSQHRNYLQTNYAQKYQLDFTNKVCVHIRRGDYTDHKIFSILNEDYYEKALKILFSKNNLSIFFVFSDDIPSISSWTFWKKYPVLFFVEDDPLCLLYLMSSCNAFILANSTLSLNAYYIHNNFYNTDVVISSKYFDCGNGGPRYYIDDLIPITDKITILD
jgi:hypothetical protein